MTIPGIVQSSLGDEQVAARVALGGEDELFVTPTRTLIYRADGLLSDESVDEFPHDAERVDVTEKRRKTKITLEYGLDGARSFAVPNSRADDALHPVLAGVLNAGGVTEPGETVKQTYLFSELTLVITSARIIKHIGASVWDDEFEEFHYDDVTGLAFEEGSVATQIVIEVDGRPQRIKAPNEQARDVRERLESALFAHYGVGTIEALNAAVSEDDESDTEPEEDVDAGVSFGEGVQPLEANPPNPNEVGPDGGAAAEGANADAGTAIDTADAAGSTTATESAVESPSVDAGDDESVVDPRESEAEAPAETDGNSNSDEAILETPDAERGDEADIEGRLDELTQIVERQNELLSRQQRTIEKLIEELSRGR